MNTKEEYLKTRWPNVSRMVSSRNPSNWVELMEGTPESLLSAVESGYRNLIAVLKTVPITPDARADLIKELKAATWAEGVEWVADCKDIEAARLEEELERIKDHAVKVSEYIESFEFKVIKEEIAEQMRNHVARLHHPKEITCPVQGQGVRFFSSLF